MINAIDLSGLNDHKQEKVRNMLREESAVFSVGDSDIVEVNSNFMNISLNYQVPVQLSYNSIHRTLRKTLNKYIKDLLNKQWIANSESVYSSPLTAAEKKKGMLRLCCDYKHLTNKTIRYHHPLTRIQNIILNFHGSRYFSLLDQCKTYH